MRLRVCLLLVSYYEWSTRLSIELGHVTYGLLRKCQGVLHPVPWYTEITFLFTVGYLLRMIHPFVYRVGTRGVPCTENMTRVLFDQIGSSLSHHVFDVRRVLPAIFLAS